DEPGVIGDGGVGIDAFDRHWQVKLQAVASAPRGLHVQVAAALRRAAIDRLPVDAQRGAAAPAWHPHSHAELGWLLYFVEFDAHAARPWVLRRLADVDASPGDAQRGRALGVQVYRQLGVVGRVDVLAKG